MAKILTIGLDNTSAEQLEHALLNCGHQFSHQPEPGRNDEMAQADIVFASGEGKRYVPLLRRVRDLWPGLPFVVVTRIPETSDWLDALEAGATDYCSGPFDPRHMSWLMEAAVPDHRTAVAAV